MDIIIGPPQTNEYNILIHQFTCLMYWLKYHVVHVVHGVAIDLWER
jgi:hypothetical protein